MTGALIQWAQGETGTYIGTLLISSHMLAGLALLGMMEFCHKSQYTMGFVRAFCDSAEVAFVMVLCEWAEVGFVMLLCERAEVGFVTQTLRMSPQ